MFKKKLLSLFILSTLCFSLTGVLIAVDSAKAQTLRQEIIGPELGEVAHDVYEATADTGAPGATRELPDIIVLVINTVLGLLGVIFLIVIIYAGFLWMTAGGNEDQVSKAKKLLTNGIIGVVIVIAAYSISYFVLQAILPAT